MVTHGAQGVGEADAASTSAQRAPAGPHEPPHVSATQEIVSAFEVLSDEQRRQQYDLELLELLDVEE